MFFPHFDETDVACEKCDKENCLSRGKHQRNRRDFEVTSGRCPKLPDRKGFVHRDERENQKDAYPFVHVQVCVGGIQLSINIPGEKKPRKVYQTKSGYWYYKTKNADGGSMKQAVSLGGYDSLDALLYHAMNLDTNYCLIPCTICDFTI